MQASRIGHSCDRNSEGCISSYHLCSLGLCERRDPRGSHSPPPAPEFYSPREVQRKHPPVRLVVGAPLNATRTHRVVQVLFRTRQLSKRPPIERILSSS